MHILKKLIFVPFYLVCLSVALMQLSSMFKSDSLLFIYDFYALVIFIIPVIFISLSSFLFVLFATFSADWKFVIPVSLLASLTPFLFFTTPDSFYLSVGIFVSQIIIFAFLDNKLKNYLNFNPNSILGPSIKRLSTFFIIVLCAVYFTFISKQVLEKGFQIPDSLIDTAINLASGLEQTDTTENQTPKLSISKEFTKQLVKDQLDTVLKPYLSFIPAILAVLLFLTLQSLSSIINLLIYPLLWITFYILEKVGFIKFVIEQRPVKKMLV